MTKQELRKEYLNIRKNIIDKEKKSYEILKRLIETKLYNESKSIGLYYSLKSEVDTLNLINYCLADNKIVLLPKTFENGMSFYEIVSLDNLEKSSFGILEPKEGIIYDKNNIDLIIVPGVCFDKNLNRIGFGKGCYDRYLENYNGATIGICFEEQVSSEPIEVEATDIKLKYVITDKRIYY